MTLIACTCTWESVQIAPEVPAVLLRAAADVFCRFPGHAEEAVDEAGATFPA